ncbi:MAG: SRPBCC family protein [Chloroflexota bacterium]
MAHEIFEYSYFIDVPVDQVYAHLAEPEHYAKLSPLVSEVLHLRRGVNAEGQSFFEYDTVEALHFAGIIPYNNPIHVIATITQANRQIASEVDTRFGVKMGFLFDLEAENGGTRIRETVHATAPRLVQGYVVDQAKQVQQARAGILKSRLEHAPA